MINKKLPIIIFTLLLFSLVIGIQDTAFQGQTNGLYIKEDMVAGLYNFNELSPTPLNFWYDSCDQYDDNDANTYGFPRDEIYLGSSTGSVEWWDVLSDGFDSNGTVGIVDSMYIMYNFDDSSDIDFIVQTPTAYRFITYSSTFDSLVLDSSSTADPMGHSNPISDVSEVLYHQMVHPSFVDYDNDNRTEIIAVVDEGNVYLQGYDWNPTTEDLEKDADVRLDITDRELTEDSTGNVNCFESVNINKAGGSELADICIIGNSKCNFTAYEINPTNITEWYSFDMSTQCENALGGSTTSGLSGIISNMDARDLFLGDLQSTYWITFQYLNSNGTDADVFLFNIELDDTSPNTFQDLIITSSLNNINSTWEEFEYASIYHEYMSGDSSVQHIVAIHDNTDGGFADITYINAYDYYNSSYRDTAILNTDTVSFEKGFFYPQPSVIGGFFWCTDGPTVVCYDSNGDNSFNMSFDIDSLSTADKLIYSLQFCSDHDTTNDPTALFFGDDGVEVINYNIGGDGDTLTPSLNDDFGVVVENDEQGGSCMIGYMDTDVYPDFFCYNTDTGYVEWTISGNTNFPPTITASHQWSNTAECFIASNETGGEEFCWNVACEDNEDDFVRLYVDWNESAGFERHIAFGDQRCSDATTFEICHEYNSTGNYTPTFLINQSATFPQNSDSITESDVLEVGNASFCETTEGGTVVGTDPITNYTSTQINGSFKTGFDNFLTQINVTDTPSRLGFALLIMLGFAILIYAVSINGGMDGGAIIGTIVVSEVILYLLLTYWGLIPIGILITLIVLFVGFGIFKVIGNFQGNGNGGG